MTRTWHPAVMYQLQLVFRSFLPSDERDRERAGSERGEKASCQGLGGVGMA